MTPDIDSLLDLTADQVRAITAEAHQELLRRILAGEDPQPVIAEIQARWAGKYQDTLTESFSSVLGRAVGIAEVRAMPIGDVVLSERLYAHNRETTAVVRRIVKEHAAGMHSARELALRVYEGYGFKAEGDPLAVKTKLPKYLRAALQEPTYEEGLQRILTQGRAATIKTPALRAAYLQSVKALEDGPGSARLEKLTRIAWFERNRYFANRIAQTELARAHSDQRHAEIMADDQIEVVRWRMSSTHPRTDICDLHAKVDKYGIGPGLYPKAKAPKPPAHPFCRCKLSPAITETSQGARAKPAAERVWLRKMMQEQGIPEAARVMGSRAKLAAALTNAPIDEIININRPKAYWVGRAGAAAGRMPGMDFNDFFSGRAKHDKHPVAQMSAQDMALFGAKQPTVWLSRQSMDEHKLAHPEIGAEDYLKVQSIIDRGEVYRQKDTTNRFALLHVDGVVYRAAIKVVDDGEKTYLLTLFRNTKAKPPKGAVRLR